MELKTNDQKTSYALGLQMAMQITQMPLDFDQESFMGGFMDMLENNKPQISQSDFTELMEALFKRIEEEHKHSCGGDCGCDGNCGGCGGNCGDGAENAKEGDAFRAENAKKEGVETLASGLQIKMLRKGVGRQPEATDTVKVHYTGKLIDGTVFDSSLERGEPLTFSLNQVIPGWTEGMQHVSIGGKAELVIPPELGYGAQGAGGVIPPQATLIFEVELIDIL